jgi:hypothetical protein
MRVLRQSLLKNHKRGFTLFEVLLACAVVCMLMWSSRHIYAIYRALLFSVAVDQVTAVCHALTHEARLTGSEKMLRIILPSSYSTHNGSQVQLPPGVEWGVRGARVYGPPSSPVHAVTTPVVGGEQERGTYIFTWHATGARTPGTVYLSAADGSCAAITFSRAACGTVTPWRLEKGRWIKK